jgi:hypothetical protein
METAKGYFIGPEGQTVPINGDWGRHVMMVVQNPERFGLSKREIQQVQKQYGDPTSEEGKARDHILIAALKHGWARVRDMDGTFSVQVWRLNDGVKEGLYRLFRKAARFYGPMTTVVIHSLQNGHQDHFLIGDAATKLYSESLSPEAQALQQWDEADVRIQQEPDGFYSWTSKVGGASGFATQRAAHRDAKRKVLRHRLRKETILQQAIALLLNEGTT